MTCICISCELSIVPYLDFVLEHESLGRLHPIHQGMLSQLPPPLSLSFVHLFPSPLPLTHLHVGSCWSSHWGPAAWSGGPRLSGDSATPLRWAVKGSATGTGLGTWTKCIQHKVKWLLDVTVCKYLLYLTVCAVICKLDTGEEGWHKFFIPPTHVCMSYLHRTF